MTGNAAEPTRDYAAEAVAAGTAAPDRPDVYNAVRLGIDHWMGSTSESYCREWDGPTPGLPIHDDGKGGDPYCDGMARYIVTRLRWAGVIVDAP